MSFEPSAMAAPSIKGSRPKQTPKFSTNTDSISELPNQRKRVIQKKGTTFSMLVVGESGLGKSTFIRSLLGSEFTSKVYDTTPMNSAAQTKALGHNPETLGAVASGAPAPSPRSEVHSTAEIEVHNAIVVENDFETRLTVIDTPGFGDYTNNENTWVPVVSYIDAQHEHYMCQEEQPDRAQLTDTRVNVCLYFLAPTRRILELDLVAMRELGRRVNLVPVIAKGDSMTPEDLVSFKQLIRTAIKENSIEVWVPPSIADTPMSNWPCAIVASDEFVMLPSGQRTRGRQYRWGIVDIHNPEHSDFELLRNLLFGKHMLDLIDATANVHYSRQRKSLRILRLRRALNLDKAGQLEAAKADELSFEDQAAGGQTTGDQITGDQAAGDQAAGDQITGEQATESEPMKRVSTKLLPADRPLLAFMNGLRTSVGPLIEQPPTVATDVAEEAMQSMPGIDLLLAISRFGQKFLSSERHEHDILLRQRTIALKAQFDIVVKFQEDRFDQQVAELEKTRDQLSQEISGLSDFNEQLMAEIRQLEVAGGRRH